MRDIPPALAERLDRETTSLCHCWRLTRRDGVVLGFTDHDEAIAFEGTTFAAATGLSAAQVETTLGLAAGSGEVSGALSHASVEEADIVAGRYDGARVECFVVDWRAPEARMRLDVAEIGEIRRGALGFSAELRGPAAKLDRLRGRLYRRRCDAVFGDARCGFAAGEAPHTQTITVVEAGERAVVVAGLSGVHPGDCADGRLAVIDGAAAGSVATIASALADGPGRTRLSLAEPMRAGPEAGDAVRLTVGCDKRFATCRDRFANAANFRGFPHMPGGDAALNIAKRDQRHDGRLMVP